jgi:tRNA 2-thiouridine synthesizing protein B
MTLHTWNKATSDAAPIVQCLEQLSADDALLLLEDGVYAAMDADFLRRLERSLDAGARLYCLAADLAARGISARISPRATVVGYKEFVALSLRHERVVNWI